MTPLQHPIDPFDMMRRTEMVIASSANRYRITVQIAQRAKRRHFEENREDEDSHVKHVIHAIYELSDELLTPGVLAD